MSYILSLLRDSEAHRNTLMKLLNTVFVLQEISVNQLKSVCESITSSNGLGFTNFNLPPEGRNHNKALNISMECKGTTLSCVLVDISSSLIVTPKISLMKIEYTRLELRPSDLVVKVFYG